MYFYVSVMYNIYSNMFNLLASLCSKSENVHSDNSLFGVQPKTEFHLQRPSF